MRLEKISVAGTLVGLLFLAAAVYFLLLPLFSPRGVYGWGHYRLIDIYAGVPSLLAAAVALAFALGRRGAAFRLASVAISTLVSLVLIDAIYAVAVGGILKQPEATDFWFDGTSISRDDNQPDPELGFKRKPNIEWRGRLTDDGPELSYRTDERGFRNPTGLTQADIVFIGDSFTEAASVSEEETFVQIVGRRTGLSVANFGIGHFGPQQELITLQRYALPLSPKTVVWQVFEGNDLSDARRFADWKAEPIKPRTWGRRYADASLIVHLLEMTRPEEMSPVHRMRMSDGSTGPVHLDYYYAPEEPATEAAGFQELLRAIQTAQDLCRSRGIEFIVVFVPIKVRVLEPFVVWESEDRRRFLAGGKADDGADLSNRVSWFCGEIGCRFVDTTPALRAAAARDNRRVFKTGPDTHLDVDGHRAVADMIIDTLR